jgi:hypothetical protein
VLFAALFTAATPGSFVTASPMLATGSAKRSGRNIRLDALGGRRPVTTV